MKKNMRAYIEQAKKSTGSQHLNFVDSRRFVQQPNMYANGAGAPASGVKKSMPYSVNIVSVSGVAVNDFDILGSYEYVTNSGFTAGGNLVIGSITISSGIPGVTYRELLYQTQNNPFTVGLTYLTSSNTLQLQEVFTIITKDSNGTAVTIPIVPAFDPYQQLQTVNIVNQEYRIDGFTKLRFASIGANTSLNVRFYPSDNLNPARALSGQNTGKQFGDPEVIRR